MTVVSAPSALQIAHDRAAEEARAAGDDDGLALPELRGRAQLTADAHVAAGEAGPRAP